MELVHNLSSNTFSYFVCKYYLEIFKHKIKLLLGHSNGILSMYMQESHIMFNMFDFNMIYAIITQYLSRFRIGIGKFICNITEEPPGRLKSCIP